MRIVAGFGVFCVFGGASILGQTSPPSTNSDGATVICVTPVLPDKGDKDGKGTTATACKTTAIVPACPLDMHVRQRASGTLVSTDAQGRRVETFAARLTLELKDPRLDRSSQRMVSATVTVRGWNPKARAMPLDSGGGRGGDHARTMTVPLTGGGPAEASADLELPGFTAARVVRLESITFDDGQVWNFGSCQAAPDLYMPVGDSN